MYIVHILCICIRRIELTRLEKKKCQYDLINRFFFFLDVVVIVPIEFHAIIIHIARRYKFDFVYFFPFHGRCL